MNLNPLNLFARCPTSRDLQRFLDSDLGHRRAAKISMHVNECPSCQKQLDELTAEVPAFFDDLIGPRDGQPSLQNLIQRLQSESIPYSSAEPDNTSPAKQAELHNDSSEPAVSLFERLGVQKNRLAALVGILMLVVATASIGGLIYSNRIVSRRVRLLESRRNALLKTVEDVVLDISAELEQNGALDPDAIQKRLLTISIDGLNSVAPSSLTCETQLLEAELLFRLGAAAYRMDELDTAVVSLNRCIECVNELQENQQLAADATDIRRKHLLRLRGRAVVCRAMVWLKQGLVEPAHSALDLELQALESLPADAREDALYLDELGKGCVTLSKQINDFRKAEAYLQKALALAGKITGLIQSHPESGMKPNNRFENEPAADGLQTLAALTEFADRKYDLADADAPEYDSLLHQHLNAIAPYSNSLSSVDHRLYMDADIDNFKITAQDYWDYALEVVSQTDLSKEPNLRDIALCYEMIASLKYRECDFEQAINAYRSALEFRSKLRAIEPNNVGDFQALIETRLQLADVLRSSPGENVDLGVEDIQREVTKWIDEHKSAENSEKSRRWYARVVYALRQLAGDTNPTAGNEDF